MGEYDPFSGAYIVRRGTVQVGWGFLAVAVFIGIIYGGQWAVNCFGSQGWLEFKEQDWLGKSSQ